MQNNHKPQQNCPEKVFKIMSSLFFSNLKFQFSDRHNSLCGYSDFLARLFEMYRYSQYAETAHNSRFIKDAKNQCKRIPYGKWMLGVIKQVRYDYMLTRCLKMADRTVMRMKRHGMLRVPGCGNRQARHSKIRQDVQHAQHHYLKVQERNIPLQLPCHHQLHSGRL